MNLFALMLACFLTGTKVQSRVSLNGYMHQLHRLCSGEAGDIKSSMIVAEAETCVWAAWCSKRVYSVLVSLAIHLPSSLPTSITHRRAPCVLFV